MFTLAQMDQGIDALLANASELTSDARLLLQGGRFPRAFALAHLAREEMSKVVMLQSAGIRVLADHPVDWKRLNKRLRDHRSKLRLEIFENALLLKAMLAQDKLADTVIAGLQHAADYRNDLKNAAIYVGLEDGTFQEPKAQISERQADRTVQLAEHRLQQLVQDRKDMGRLSDRQPGSLKGMQNFDQIPPDQVSAAIEAAAQILGAITKHRSEGGGEA